MTDPKEMRLLRQKTNEEMKNRISMALKDPILQQGFEIICKENAGLKARLNAINLLTPELEKMSKLKNQQLTKAKDIILKLYNAGRDVLMCRAEEKAYDNLDNAINDKSIEQFLKEIEKCLKR